MKLLFLSLRTHPLFQRTQARRGTQRSHLSLVSLPVCVVLSQECFLCHCSVQLAEVTASNYDSVNGFFCLAAWGNQLQQKHEAVPRRNLFSVLEHGACWYRKGKTAFARSLALRVRRPSSFCAVRCYLMPNTVTRNGWILDGEGIESVGPEVTPPKHTLGLNHFQYRQK